MKTFAQELKRRIRSGMSPTTAMRRVWQDVRAGLVAPPSRRRKPKATRTAQKAAPARRRAPPRGRRKARRARRNPDPLSREVERAARRFAGFRGAEPHEVVKLTVPPLPRVVLTIGECIGIMYRTTRDGKVENYQHDFRKSSRPALVCSSDGKQLYLLGGAYSVTDHGIEDA